METEIKHVNFFNGQFLKEGEFQAEQSYHIHMRRRMNYAIFERAGVIVIDPEDLAIEVVDAVSKTFRVRAGMALAIDSDTREGIEIILRNDQTVSLIDEGVSAGETAWITLRYHEQGSADPPSEGDTQNDTRVEEQAVVRVDTSQQATNDPPDEGAFVVLGRLLFDTMLPPEDPDPLRQLAILRGTLVGGAPAVTLSSIALSAAVLTARVGDPPVPLTATGTFSDASSRPLAASDGLVWTSSAPLIAPVGATGSVTFLAEGNAVITASAQGQSATANVTVSPALGVPSIALWPNNADRRRHGTETLTILGDQFGAPMSVLFLNATVGDPDVEAPATVVSVNEATVVVPGPFSPTPANPALVRSGQIRVTTPAGTSLPSPLSFVLETV